MRATIEHARIALKDPDDIEARGNLMWAATCSINGWAYPGDGWTPIHQVGHVLTSIHGVSHGVSLCMLMRLRLCIFVGLVARFRMCMHVCVRLLICAFVRACACASLHACPHASAHMSERVGACVRASALVACVCPCFCAPVRPGIHAYACACGARAGSCLCSCTGPRHVHVHGHTSASCIMSAQWHSIIIIIMMMMMMMIIIIVIIIIIIIIPLRRAS